MSECRCEVCALVREWDAHPERIGLLDAKHPTAFAVLAAQTRVRESGGSEADKALVLEAAKQCSGVLKEDRYGKDDR